KVERSNACNDAERLAQRIYVDAGARSFRELALHELRNAKRELDDFDSAQNIALGIGKSLAMLTRKQLRQSVIVSCHQFQELHQHANPPLRVGGCPFGLCRLGVL